MIGMRSEKLLDAPPVEPKLLFDRKKHLYLTQGQEALGFDSGCGASKFAGPSKDLHASRPLVATPEPAAVQEVLPLSLAGLSQGPWGVGKRCKNIQAETLVQSSKASRAAG